jgi:hypothetical protein
MAFIVENDNVISFAEYDDLFARDSRVIENNESLTDDVVEDLLIRATERILTKLRLTQWWMDYYMRIAEQTTYRTRADIPALDPNKIADRQNDFTDLCVYTALAEFILPKVADFGNEDDAERNKMGYYQNKADSLFQELVTVGDWYDFDDDASISSLEKEPGRINLKRIR